MIDAKREAKFWSKAESRDGCFIWTGYKTPKGYGKVGINGRAQRAHRVAYELTHGPIPDGIQIDHTCHNPSCILPDHLRATTHKQNQENRGGPVRTNASGVRGVTRHKQSGRWVANVGHNGTLIYLGMFGTIAEAEAVVLAKRLELFTHNDRDRHHPTPNPTTPEAPALFVHYGRFIHQGRRGLPIAALEKMSSDACQPRTSHVLHGLRNYGVFQIISEIFNVTHGRILGRRNA